LFTGRNSYITSNSERAHDGLQTHVREDGFIYPEYLKALGYRTRHHGKCHIGTAKFMSAFGENDSPWDRWSPPWFDDDGYSSFLESKSINGFSFFREIHGRSPSSQGNGNFLGGWVQANGCKPFPREATYPAYIADMALAGLWACHGSDRPFYFQIDWFEPHQPFFIPSGMEEREREMRASLALSLSWAMTNNGDPNLGLRLPLVYERYRKYWGLSELRTVEDYLVANALKYEVLDEQVGRVLSWLKNKGLYDDCLVMVTADHGEMNCRGGLVDKGAFLNPRVLQVPLYLKMPIDCEGDAGVPMHGTSIHRAVSYLM